LKERSLIVAFVEQGMLCVGAPADRSCQAALEASFEWWAPQPLPHGRSAASRKQVTALTSGILNEIVPLPFLERGQSRRLVLKMKSPPVSGRQHRRAPAASWPLICLMASRSLLGALLN
jgi:hypothetical protein